MDNKRQTTLRLRPPMLDALDAEAKDRGWSRSTLIEQVLAKWLSEQGQPAGVRVVLPA